MVCCFVGRGWKSCNRHDSRAASSEGSARHLACSYILRKYYVKDLEPDRWKNRIDIYIYMIRID